MNANVTTLALPDGGTVDIPLPGSTKNFAINPPSLLSSSDGGSRLPLILVGVVIGVALGVGLTAWYMRS